MWDFQACSAEQYLRGIGNIDNRKIKKKSWIVFEESNKCICKDLFFSELINKNIGLSFHFVDHYFLQTQWNILMTSNKVNVNGLTLKIYIIKYIRHRHLFKTAIKGQMKIKFSKSAQPKAQQWLNCSCYNLYERLGPARHLHFDDCISSHNYVT